MQRPLIAPLARRQLCDIGRLDRGQLVAPTRSAPGLALCRLQKLPDHCLGIADQPDLYLTIAPDLTPLGSDLDDAARLAKGRWPGEADGEILRGDQQDQISPPELLAQAMQGGVAQSAGALDREARNPARVGKAPRPSAPAPPQA